MATRESIKGNTICIIASGPSLTQEDVDLVKAAGVPIVAVNNSWRMDPDCYAIFAGDYRWWQSYGKEVKSKAPRFSRSKNAQKSWGAKRVKTLCKGGYNSGAAALEWVLMKKAATVILLGFDCSLKHGKHWHGRHTKTPDPNAHRVKRWHEQFAEVRKIHKKGKVLNCSRYTELTVFPTMELEQALESLA